MLVSILEVALVAMIALCLLAPQLRGAARRVWTALAGAPGPRHAAPATGGGGRSAAERDEVRRRWAGRIGGALGAVAIANFLAFSVHTRNLGGSADSGRRAEGR